MVSKLIKANGCRGLEMGRVDAKNHPRLIHRTNWSNQILNCLLLQDPSSIWRRPDFRSMDLTDLPSTGLSKLWNQNKCFYAPGDRWFTSLFLLMFIITCFLCGKEFLRTFEWNIWNILLFEKMHTLLPLFSIFVFFLRNWSAWINSGNNLFHFNC